MLFKSKLPRDRFFSVVIAGLCLVLVLGGGAAVAAELITGADIEDGTVTKADIKDNNLTGVDVKDGSVGKIDITDNSLTGADLNDGSVGTKDIKDESLTGTDLKDGSVGSADLAPDAVAFPNSLWGTVLRNQSGGAESGLQAGPGVPPLGEGSLRLYTADASAVAAYGNSIDFAAFQLEDIVNVSYSTFTATGGNRPSLRIEIDPHLVSDATPAGVFEFTTLIHLTTGSGTGWVADEDALADDAWYLTGDEGTTTGCNDATYCTFDEVVAALNDSGDPDTAPPAISTGVYFGLGAFEAADTAVDDFVFNDFQFDFEPMGAFLIPGP